ncbi:MAG: patatin-like phospholipase family protein [Planctomycetes bacterium]|nr:patatin-like phospholipase family protein [Planctomycetota bacterium]
MSEVDKGQTALVMSGGGARAAYQVGCLRAIARHVPDFEAPILTGVSAGAINAAFLASRTGPMGSRLPELVDLWSTLEPDQVFDVGSLKLARNVVRTGLKLVTGGWITAPRPRAFVDTGPLRTLLNDRIGDGTGNLRGLRENLQRGDLRALAITTSSYSTGQSITWVEGCGIDEWERAHRKSERCTLTIEHIMASASLPIFFPAVRLGEGWYGDGGIRLTAPLAPAVHLGAKRILAISTRYARTRAEADRASIVDYPPPAQIVGSIFSAIFLDLFDADALALDRVNKLIRTMTPQQRGPLREVDLLVLRPSQDLGRLANDYEARLPRAFRFLTRGLGTRETKSNDFLSLVMFQSDYLSRLIEIGERDAEARMAEIERFLK